MTRKPNTRISTLGSRLTSIVSVTLVLIILGILGMTLRASSALSDDIRSNIGFVVKLSREASDIEAGTLRRQISEARFTESLVYSSAEAILAEESELMGTPLDSLLEENPFGAEIEVKVKPAYACTDSITAIAAAMESVPTIDEVVTQATVVDSVNSFLNRLSVVLLAIAAALLVISFVLINNTVSLAVYSRRFIIHTMKLVGATGAFIRRPFLLAGAGTGAIAGVAAAAILAGIRAYGATFDPIVDVLLPWGTMAWLLAAVIVAGVVICVLASVFATNRYLRADYDEMFMK